MTNACCDCLSNLLGPINLQIGRGPHLHFEDRERGYLRDPERRFLERPD